MKVIRVKFYVVDTGNVSKVIKNSNILIFELPFDENKSSEENVQFVTEQISDRLDEGKPIPAITMSGKMCLLNSHTISGIVIDSIVAGSYQNKEEIEEEEEEEEK